jgi:lysophospholipase L1-like esterase
VLADLVVLREAAALQLRKDKVAVDGDFKSPAGGRDEYEPFDSAFQIGDELVGQTDRLGFVASELAVDDFDFHYRLPILIYGTQTIRAKKGTLMRRLSLFACCAISLLLAPVLPAQQGGAPAGGRGARGPAAPANQPLARDDNRHKGFLDVARAGNIDLLFVGDSITDLWRSRGKAVWDENFEPLKAANFGIGGDTTQGVLWRMQNGELEGFKAKLIVLMLGTNNINRNPNDEIVDGDRLIIQEFKQRQPQAKILLLGIFPRAMQADSPYRASIKDINSKLAKLADNKQVFYMDFGDKFLAPDGTLTVEIMADGLHPTEAGYRIWAAAILGRVKELMK